MLKQILYIFSLLFLLQAMYAQKEANIWYFGTHAGLDFNTGQPVTLFDGQLDSNEGVASIADSSGTLLFYTESTMVYNKNHTLMQNGTGLSGHQSTTQSSVIVPKPLSSTIYYIFTLMFEGMSPGLNYSEVDMSLDGGLGAVTQNKNIQLKTPCTEHLTAVKHSNGRDIWVITHGYANNAFHAYLVTPNGVSGSAVTSNSGVNFWATPSGTAGCMKVSPQGTKIGISNAASGIFLFDFNATTGVVSAPVMLSNDQYNYGLEFSASGKVMYTSSQSSMSIIQYDLTATNIPASATALSSTMAKFASLQLGSNRKIYIADKDSSYLTVINNPNIIGTGCNLEQQSVFLGQSICNFGLPNFIQSIFALSIRADHLCFGDTTEFSLVTNVVPDTVSWDFGDGNTSNVPTPTHIYNASGNYTVKVIANFNGSPEIVEKNITISLLPVINTPKNLFVCDDQSRDGKELFDLSKNKGTILGGLNPTNYSITYHDSPSDTENGTDALTENYTNSTNPQIIYVRVKDNISGCYSTTSFTLNVILQPNIDMENEYSFCEKGNVTITAPSGFNSYLWSTGATTPSITINEVGTYTLKVTHENNGILCEASKTIKVTLSAKPIIDNIIIKDWTDETNSITIHASGHGKHLFSIDGINYQESNIFTGLKPGIYTVYVKDSNDCGVVMQQIAILMFPRYFTPNGDGVNETWHVKYSRYEPDMFVYIFDRYGKLITSLRATGPGWDGTLNGHKLPSTDYWFTVKRKNGMEFKGHFSMIR